MTKAFSFRILATEGKARRGLIEMPRGEIRTPAFMPVGTGGTVKAMYMDQVRGVGADIILGNTYHLMLRPGAERVARLGGLHEFARWPWPILTDSGGFQVMSLSKLRKLTENGVTFRSHIDGSPYEMSPERSIEIQGLLDSDVQMQLDECTALPAKPREIERAMELSLRWAESRSSDQSTAPLSITKWPRSTVQAGVSSPGRSGQSGRMSCAWAVPIPASVAAARRNKRFMTDT